MESEELAGVAADNMVAIHGAPVTPSERGRLCSEVRAHFRNASARMSREEPEAYRALDEMQLTGEEHSALLESMRQLRDPRLRQLGQDVAKVLYSSRRSGTARRRLAEYLLPRVEEVRRLHRELTPAPLRGDSEDDELDVDALERRLEGLKTMTLFQTIDSWDVELDVTRSERRLLSERRLFFNRDDGSSILSNSLGVGKKGFSMYAELDEYWEKFRDFAWEKYDKKLPSLTKLLNVVDLEKLARCFTMAMANPSSSNIKLCGVMFTSQAEDVMRVMTGKQPLHKAEEDYSNKLR